MTAERNIDMDDVDEVLGQLEIITDLAWDLATEIGFDGSPDPRLLNRVQVLTKIARRLTQDLSEVVHADAIPMRPVDKSNNGEN